MMRKANENNKRRKKKWWEKNETAEKHTEYFCARKNWCERLLLARLFLCIGQCVVWEQRLWEEGARDTFPFSRRCECDISQWDLSMPHIFSLAINVSSLQSERSTVALISSSTQTVHRDSVRPNEKECIRKKHFSFCFFVKNTAYSILRSFNATNLLNVARFCSTTVSSRNARVL